MMSEFAKAARMLDRLRHIAEAERLQLSDAVLVEIAEKHSGNLREALAALDEARYQPQCAQCGKGDPLNLYRYLWDNTILCTSCL